jgi:regulator of replication initiation timing
MNTVRIFICATFALLIAALVHSYTTNGGEKSISELKDELEKVRLENEIKRERATANTLPYQPYNTGTPYTAPEIIAQIPQTAPPAEFVNPLTPADPSDIDLSDNAKLAAENARLKKQQALQASENNMLQVEAGAIQKELQTRRKPEEDRAAEIAQALVMARVKIFDPKSGIIVLDLERAENLVTGQVLGIRRGTAGGIIGRIKLGNIESRDLGYADPIPQSFFGDNVDVQVGDEIIVIP